MNEIFYDRMIQAKLILYQSCQKYVQELSDMIPTRSRKLGIKLLKYTMMYLNCKTRNKFPTYYFKRDARFINEIYVKMILENVANDLHRIYK